MKGKDGNFYSTRLTRNETPVRLEVPHEQRSLLYGALWFGHLEPSIVRYIGRRAEQYKDYAIVVIEKVLVRLDRRPCFCFLIKADKM